MATKSMDLPKLMIQFGSEDKCHAFLESLRWPDGVACPRCEGATISRIHARRQFECDSCRYQFSVRVGTVLQDSKLPLAKWFLATFIMIESKKGVSSNQLKRMLGVSYKTAWFLSHRIRAAMGEVETMKLSNIVEADETFVGGKPRRGSGRRDEWGGIPGPNPDKPKTVVLGAVERGGQVRLRVAPDRSKRSIGEFLLAEVDEGTVAVYTDEWRAYKGVAGDANTKHETVNHSVNEWVRGEVHTNTAESVWSLLKRSVIGSYHQLSMKHLPAYLDELEWRFNNRENPYLFRDTVRALMSADTMQYKDLIAN